MDTRASDRPMIERLLTEYARISHAQGDLRLRMALAFRSPEMRRRTRFAAG